MTKTIVRDHLAIFADLLEAAGYDMLVFDALVERSVEDGRINLRTLRAELAKHKAAQGDSDTNAPRPPRMNIQ